MSLDLKVCKTRLYTLNNLFRNPIYQGSFSLLISEPIDKFKKSGSSFEERVISNNQSIELPTLIQFLKSQQVLRPLEKELQMSSWGIRNGLRIELDGNKPFVSRGILVVKVRGKNKIQNKVILEKLSKRYLKAASEQREERLITGINFLDTEVPIIEKKKSIIKKKIEDFRLANNVLEPLNYANNIENKRISIQATIPGTTQIRRSDDSLRFNCKTKSGKQAFGSIPSEIEGAKLGASVLFIDLGITDAITDKHREYPASFVVPVKK